MSMDRKITARSRIGVVNRGEAAVRFIHAMKEYNTEFLSDLTSVVFHIEPESEAAFVKEADLSYNLSTMEGAEKVEAATPYLDGSFIVKCLKLAGCDAAWVGWGFLAEDPIFAKLLEDNGVTLLGPKSTAMSLLGDKIKAKELADKADVPTVPWSKGAVKDAEHAKEVAEAIGYPVILKAAYGGGGRGIRKVFSPGEMATAYETTSEEIGRFFGDRTLFIEALVVRGRHLEVQCMADYHGHVKTFSVRDCSVQRNNQKIVEETPPPGLPETTLTSLEEHSKNLLLAADYQGAATVEYLYDLDRDQGFFMEVNTRLQVEHPITENLFNADMVRLQLQVALGESIEHLNKSAQGHVIELRLNAEDPAKNFMPTPGRVIAFRPPFLPGIRIDSGIETGSVITPDFDSMVAKIIAHGSSRANAIAKLQLALQNLKIEIENGTTNQGFALAILADEAFKKGGVETSYIEGFIKEKRHEVARDWDIAAVAAAIYQYRKGYDVDFHNLSAKLTRHSIPRNIPEHNSEFSIQMQGNRYQFDVRCVNDGHYHIEVDGVSMSIEYARWGDDDILKVKAGSLKHKVQIVPRNDAIQCEVDGHPYLVELDDGGVVGAPSPSVVLTVEVEKGRRVKKGDLLMTLEAMKMEIAVTAKDDAIVDAVLVKPGEKVDAGQTLVEVEKIAEDTGAEQAPVAERISFDRLALKKNGTSASDREAYWDYLTRDYLSVFTGFDYPQTMGTLNQLGRFIEQNPDYKPRYVALVVSGCVAFTSVFNLLRPRSKVRGGKNSLDYLTHYFLRNEDREKGLPEGFVSSLNKALSLYSWIDRENDNDLRVAAYHLLKAFNTRDDASAILIDALFGLVKIYEKERVGVEPDELAMVLENLSSLRHQNSSLMDATIHTRYELIDKFQINAAQQKRREAANLLLDSALGRLDEDKIQEVMESGPQVIDYLLALNDLNTAKRKRRLELIAWRFNRDRVFVSEVDLGVQNRMVYGLELSHKRVRIKQSVAVFEGQEFLKPLAWLEEAHALLEADRKEAIIIVNKCDKSSADDYIKHMEANPLSVDLATLGISIDGAVTYYSFGMQDGKWQEIKRRRKFSPLRYRELRIDRLENFELSLIYHTHFVHLLMLVAKDNPKDQRLFAFVEIPEAGFRVVDSKIHTIENFRYSIYEAVQAIRLHQTKKRRFYWNRIIVHIGQTHPITLEQVDQYPKSVINLVSGVGLEKMVIYTKISGKRRESIDAEVLVENFSTKYSVRARRPSKRKLVPQSPYVNRLIRSARGGNLYPYQLIRMLTDPTGPFPRGVFQEYDLDGDNTLTLINNRAYGSNTSNVVFGVIENTLSGNTYKRVLLLGDPSKDLGSLAEEECRRVVSAIDLADELGVPVEWVPISSGAAIGMDSGTENLDWTAVVLKRLIEFTQSGGEVNIIVAGINVGAQSYWNAEATMLMHTSGLLIMTRYGAMVLTGKKALDFSGSISGTDNIEIGGAEKIMAVNGQAQVTAGNLEDAYQILFQHYGFTYTSKEVPYGYKREVSDSKDRNVCEEPYLDKLEQGFTKVGDVLGLEKNADRKKPFDLRQIMFAVKDRDVGFLERWRAAEGAESAIVWETSIGGHGVGLIGVDSQSISRIGEVPNDGPDAWNGGTLYPLSSKKIARAINAFSGKTPVVALANISGFDGSPESLRKLQLEYGAEIGRAVVNFKGPFIFVVLARYHGGAYVVFSKALNPQMKVLAIEGAFASVIGGAPAAAVVFPRLVDKNTSADPRVMQAKTALENQEIGQKEFSELLRSVRLEKQSEVAQEFENIHSVDRALSVGSLDEIIKPELLRSKIISSIEESRS